MVEHSGCSIIAFTTSLFWLESGWVALKALLSQINVNFLPSSLPRTNSLTTFENLKPLLGHFSFNTSF